jgi:outer membrane protein OmpA-like peptidoglycan-associated protein
VQFDSGTARLTPAARESLARFAGVVASYPALNYDVEGHTDAVGRETSNRELSLKRAIAVRDFLIGQGIAASTIDVAGFGSGLPIADNASSAGRARNRRVEIVVSGGPLAR